MQNIKENDNRTITEVNIMEMMTKHAEYDSEQCKYQRKEYETNQIN